MVYLFSGHLECNSRTHAKILILKSFFLVLKRRKKINKFLVFPAFDYSSNYLMDTKKGSFDKSTEKFFTKIWIFLTQSEKLIKKYIIFENYFFSPKIVLDTKEAILTFQLISLLLLSKFFTYESPKSWRTLYTVQESAFFSKKNAGHKKCSSDNFAEIFARLQFSLLSKSEKIE